MLCWNIDIDKIKKEVKEGLNEIDINGLNVSILPFDLTSSLQISKSYLELRNKIFVLNDKKLNKLIENFDIMLDEEDEGSFSERVEDLSKGVIGSNSIVQRKIRECRTDLMRFLSFFVKEKVEKKETIKQRMEKKGKKLKEKQWKS